MDSGSESDFEFVRLVARTGRESCDDDAESLGVISLDSDEVVSSPTSSGSPGASAVIQAAEEPGSVGLSEYDHLQVRHMQGRPLHEFHRKTILQ
jgi:hypothetical protein